MLARRNKGDHVAGMGAVSRRRTDMESQEAGLQDPDRKEEGEKFRTSAREKKGKGRS